MARKKRFLRRGRSRARGYANAPVATQAPLARLARTPTEAPDEAPDAEMDPKLQDAYERVVIAAGKVLYESPTHEQIMQMLTSGPDVEGNVAEAVTTVLLQLYEKSRGTMPGEVILPAAAEVIGMALELLEAAGVQGADKADPQRIFQMIIQKFIQKGAVDPQEAQEFLDSVPEEERAKMMSDQQKIAAGGQEPGAQPAAQQPPGMIAGGMQQQPAPAGA